MTVLIYILNEGGMLFAPSELTPELLAQQINLGEMKPAPQVLDLMGTHGGALRAEVRGPAVLVIRLPVKPPGDSGPPGGPRIRRRYPIPALTRRQCEVLQALADGLTTNQTALKLGLSERAVQYHITRIKERLHASSLAHAVQRWMGTE